MKSDVESATKLSNILFVEMTDKYILLKMPKYTYVGRFLVFDEY